MNPDRPWLLVFILIETVLSSGCGGAASTNPQASISPAIASVIPGDMQGFTAQGLGSAPTWLVNDVPGGKGVVGTIDAHGNYTAPQSSPLPDSVTIRASDGATSATAGVKLIGPTAPRRLWSATSPGTMFTGVVLDVTGIAISSGASITGFPSIRKDFIVSFDTTGTQRWQTPLRDSVIVNDVAPDQTGGALLVGESDSTVSQLPWITQVTGSGQLLTEAVCNDPGSFYRIVGHGNALYLGQSATAAPANWISRTNLNGSGFCSSPIAKAEFSAGDLAADDSEFLVSGNVVPAPPPPLQVIGVLRTYDLSGIVKNSWNFDINPAIGIDSPRIAESQEGQNTFVYVGGNANNQLALAKLDLTGAVQPGWPVNWSVAGNSILVGVLRQVIPMMSGGALTLVRGDGSTSVKDKCDIRLYDKNGTLVWQIQDGVDGVSCASAALTSDGKFLVVAGKITGAQGLPSPIIEKYVLPF